MALSRRLRFEILRRDSYTCRYCGATAPDAVLQIDHVIPTTLGGGDDPSNLVTACVDCNAGKSSSSPDQAVVEDVDAAAMLFAKAMERAAEIQRAKKDDLYEQTDYFETRWDRYKTTSGATCLLPGGWRDSIDRFLAAGFDVDDLDRAIDIAMGRNGIRADERWRYFCGVVWRQLAERQEMARQLIEDGVDLDSPAWPTYDQARADS